MYPIHDTIYCVIASNNNNCYDTACVNIKVKGASTLYVPNAFTPNGDGKNDCFGISRYAGQLQQAELSIYNRWGVRVFNSTNSTDCWDGRYKGKLQDAGGFVYVINGKTFCGDIFRKGTVMLIR